MRQLTALDAQFLALESHNHTGHVSSMMVLDPTERPGGRLELEHVQALVAERLPLLPPFRWRLRTVRLNLDYPYWIDDPEFDLEYHVRELALSQPATDAKLGEQVARIVARPLDRSRPLWELYLIHGLPQGKSAVGLVDEDPSRRRRRHVGRGDPQRAARHKPRGTAGATSRNRPR